jgi:hypothetical protein
VCPEAADRAEGDALAREEERARRRAALAMRDNGDGTVQGRFTLPTLHAALLKKALEALTSPRRLGESRLDPKTGRKLPYEPQCPWRGARSGRRMFAWPPGHAAAPWSVPRPFTSRAGDRVVGSFNAANSDLLVR